jgi:hypothetical protein
MKMVASLRRIRICFSIAVLMNARGNALLWPKWQHSMDQKHLPENGWQDTEVQNDARAAGVQQ